jgi:hypothetical protein
MIDTASSKRRRRQSCRPCEHGVANGRRKLLLARGQDLGDEEWVAAGHSMQSFRVDTVGLSEPGNAVQSERRESYA